VTDLTVTNWLVSHRELTEVVTNHVSFDFDWVPVLSRVDFAHGRDHLWHDDAVSQVSLNWLWFVSWLGGLDGGDKLLGESIVTSLTVSSISHSSSLSGSEHANDLVGGHGQELVELNTSVNLLSECLLLWTGLSHGLLQPLLNSGEWPTIMTDLSLSRSQRTKVYTCTTYLFKKDL